MKNTKTYSGYRYPSQVISHAVWLYHRFTLSFRDIEEISAARGITVSYETIRNWCLKFGQQYCNQIRKDRGQLGDTWFLDEVFIKINGVLYYLWRAVDQDGDEIDILVQKRKDKSAAMQFFRKLLKGQQLQPIKIVTDKLKSYSAAKRQMRRFKSQGHAQRFLSCHGIVNNLFRLGRHLMKASNYRMFSERSFDEWDRVSCIQNPT
jgi:putative transposase